MRLELGTRHRSLLLLLLVSLAVRCLAFVAVTSVEVPLLFDEVGYYERALAWREILLAGMTFESVSTEAREQAYGEGHWPPGHPLVLALGMLVGGPSIAAARFVTVVASVATTWLVYRLTLALIRRRTPDASGEPAALAAGWLHALYPTFIAYSHYLWSETTMILMLLAGLLTALRLPSTGEGWRNVRRAAGCGVLLGMATLTRAAALPFLLAVAVWLALAGNGRRGPRMARAGTVLMTGLLVLLPWQTALQRSEGRFVPLSTLGGFNLALGNNPWVPPGLGSSWGHPESKSQLRDALETEADSRGTTWDAVAGDFAVEEIGRRPGVFVGRSLERLQMLWAPEFFPLRHVFHGAYLPPSPAVALAFGIVIVLAFLGLLGLAVSGLRRDSWVAFLVGVGMILPVLTVGLPRLQLPLLALLLPAAGWALVDLRRRRWRPRLIPLLIWGVLAVSAVTRLPKIAEHYLLPSSYYVALDPVLSFGSGGPVYTDRIRLRRKPGFREPLAIEVSGARFDDGTTSRSWNQRPAVLNLDLTSEPTVGPIELTVTAIGPGRSANVQPLSPASWRRWIPSGLIGVDVQWTGGSPPERGRRRGERATSPVQP